MAAIAATAMWSCSSEEIVLGDGEATLFLSTSLNTDLKPVSRATNEEIIENALIWISNSKGPVRVFNGSGEIPAEGVKLLSDAYTIEVWAGDSVPASFEHRYFKGVESVTLTRGQIVTASVECHIANSVVAVNYADNIDDYITDYVFTIGHSQGELEFVGQTDAKGYFMMNSRDKELKWTLTGTLVNGQSYTQEGTLENVEPATLYNFTFKPADPEQFEMGGAYFEITVDDTSLEIPTIIDIKAAPTIKGYNFDLSEPLRGKKGSFGRHSLWINAQGGVSSLILTSDYFAELFGINGNDFDLLTMTDQDLAERIRQAGITYTTTTTAIDEENTVTNIKLNFEEAFIDQLPDGNYSIRIDVADDSELHKTASATLVINVSDDAVSTVVVNPVDIWATKAVIGGVINKDSATNPVMKYRKRGDMQWIVVPSTVSGKNFSAQLTGLTAGTAYEYVAGCDGFESTELCTFTTESARQFPNSSFEHSYMRGKILEFCNEGEEEFWDTGNEGSATLNKLVTDQSTEYVHSGTYSLHLNSLFVGPPIFGKFAAGNIFIGHYMRTDGTNGVLGWGRPWTERPAKLHGYVKYAPVTVDNYNDNCPSIAKGDMDKGIIYIALLDETMTVPAESKEFPVVIATASPKKLFDKDGANVIAYGELIFNEATSADGLVEFEIPLVYNRTDVKPAYILCTMSASIGGDYFTGGAGSQMWIDDIELLYE